MAQGYNPCGTFENEFFEKCPQVKLFDLLPSISIKYKVRNSVVLTQDNGSQVKWIFPTSNNNHIL